METQMVTPRLGAIPMGKIMQNPQLKNRWQRAWLYLSQKEEARVAKRRGDVGIVMNKAIWGEIAQKRRSHTKEVERMEKMVKASHGTRMGITARMVPKMVSD